MALHSEMFHAVLEGSMQLHAAIAARRSACPYRNSTLFQHLAQKFPEISSFLNFLLAALSH